MALLLKTLIKISIPCLFLFCGKKVTKKAARKGLHPLFGEVLLFHFSATPAILRDKCGFGIVSLLLGLVSTSYFVQCKFLEGGRQINCYKINALTASNNKCCLHWKRTI